MRLPWLRSAALPFSASAPLVVFFVLPMGALLANAVSATPPPWSVWLESATLHALSGTLSTSLGAAFISLALGVPLSFLLVRTDVPLRRLLRVLLLLPAALPPYIVAMGWISLANPKAGLLNLLLGEGTFNVYGVGGVAFVLGTSGLPLVMLPTMAALERIDVAMEEAARLCGASVFRANVDVVLPLVLPAATSGAVLAFLSAASSFGVPYLLGVVATPPTPTLTTRIYGELLMGQAGLARAAALSMLLLAVALAALVLATQLAKRGAVRLSSGKGVRASHTSLRRWRWPAFALVSASTAVVVLLPMLAIGLTSLQPVWGVMEGLTTRHWRAIITDPDVLSAATNSVVLSLAAGALVTGLGLLGALTRRRSVDLLSAAPYAVPGTVLALALIIAFSRDVRVVAFERVAFVLAMGNTFWLLLVAYVLKHLALGTRNAGDALAQLDPTLPEAARVFGASRGRAFVDGTLPQLRGALLAAFVATALTCATELTLSVLLVPTGRDVLGTLIFELQSYAAPTSAAVIACAFVLVVLAVELPRALLFTRRRP